MRSELLAALGQEVILPAYQTFQTRAGELETAAAAYAANQGDTERDAVRNSPATS